ncbi:hypothetical protein ACQEU5_04085 [Marinactinospora thermotolerans]|uniref:ATP synthase protein I n=1 Tax=Marinactinospora thermotolerans DSM 45154 TaxID=1122192 RepID=A0A1T4Q9D8_9ACTN|nr:hypothetical protein [Marinactinospora thermotolerans]SKA00315.1 ATP synthase protein I [Marinactinospora thermotolerans DSM 45154]
MQEHDAKVLRGAAIPTLIVGAGCTAVFSAISGVPGAIGAVVALLLVLAFFGVSGFVVAKITKRNPDLFMPATLGGFLVKAVVLAVALVLLRGSDSVTWMDTTAFAAGALLGVIAWLAGHVRVIATSKSLHVDPVPSAVSPGAESGHETT